MSSGQQPPAASTASIGEALKRRLEAVAALFAAVILYTLLAGSLRLPGSPPEILASAAVLIAAFTAIVLLFHWRGWARLARGLGFLATAGGSLAIGESVRSLALLPASDLPSGHTLFYNAGLVWLLNVLIFALWYWELDGGGPIARHRAAYRSTDFAFPQFQLDDPTVRARWQPNMLDYLFLAFNTSTAFSPADTMVLTRPAKLLMMVQALTSLVVVAVLVSRAVSSL